MTTSLFSTPFFLGVATTSEAPYRLPIAIGGHPYLIEVPQYRRRVIEQLRDPQDSASEPGEQSFNTKGLWRRSQHDFSLGAGPKYFDDTIVSPFERLPERRRFRTSKGIDCWTRYQLSLLNDTEKKGTVGASTNLKILKVGSYLYVADGTNVRFTADPSVTNPAWTAMTGLAGTAVADITTDGTTVYVADGTNVKKAAAGVAAAGAYSATNPLYLRYANGRMLAATSTVLNELDAAGAATALKTLAFGTWAGIAASPSVFYGWTVTGDRSDVYRFSVSETTGAVLPGIVANGGWPDGETINCMSYYGGLMLLGTSRGLRLSLQDSSGSLQWGAVITEPGSVTAVEGQGEYVWFSWTNFDSTSTGLGRANLSEQTEELVPSYSSDLMATTQGTVLSVETFGSKRYFAVSGVGLYGQTAYKVASGTYWSGMIRYGNFERKIVSSFDMRHAPLVGSIQVDMVTENSTVVGVGSDSVAGTLGPGVPFTIAGADGEAVEVRLTLAAANNTDTVGPVLQRWTLRALPAPTAVEEIIVPIILADTVLSDSGEGEDLHYDPLAEYEYLLGLVTSKASVTYQEGTTSQVVYVSSLEVQPNNWNSGLSFFEGLVFARLVTVNPQG